MKNIFKTILVMFVFVLAVGKVQAQGQVMNLDMAIVSVASNLTGALDRETRIAVLPIESQSAQMTHFLTDGLIIQLVNMQGFVVTETAVGARFVISGNVVPVAGNHLFTAQVVDTTNNAILRIFTVNIQHDANVAALLGTAAGQVAVVAQPPREPRPRRPPLPPGNNWISFNYHPLLIGGLMYERMLNAYFSWGLNAYARYGYRFNFNHFHAGAFTRWYPAGKTFFLGLGLGWHYFYYFWERLGHRESLSMSGISLTPELGWRIRSRRRFFFQAGATMPVIIGSGGIYRRAIRVEPFSGVRVRFLPYLGFGLSF